MRIAPISQRFFDPVVRREARGKGEFLWLGDKARSWSGKSFFQIRF